MKLIELECPNCGGPLDYDENTNIAACSNCSSTFLLDHETPIPRQPKPPRPIETPRQSSIDRQHRIFAGFLIFFGSAAFCFLLISGINGVSDQYRQHSSQQAAYKSTVRTKDGLPASPLFQAFVAHAFHKDNYHEVSSEELASLRYLGIANNSYGYQFSYSFTDAFDTSADIDFNSTVKTVVLDSDLDYLSSDLSCFTGLTRLDNTVIRAKEGDAANLKSLRSLTARQSLSEITKAYHTEQISELSVLYNSQTTLAGIEQFPKLEKLTYNSGSLNDISLLSTCTGLRGLHLLDCDKIEDFSVLYTLTGLEELSLRTDKLKDISFIKEMPKLWYFYLYDTEVLDLSALTGNTSITHLSIEENSEVQDYSPINTMPQIQSLRFARYYSQKMPVLDNLSNATELYFARMDDISFLKNFPQCTSLTLDGCNAKGPEVISAMTELTSLKLEGVYNGIYDFTFLLPLSKLKYLDISGMSVYGDASALFSIPSLTSLNIDSCKFAMDFSNIAEQPSLTELHMHEMELYTNIERREDGSITYLNYDTELLEKYMSFLEHLPNLTYLDVGKNKLTNLDFIDYLPALEQLHIEGNYITDLTPLEKLEHLRTVYVKDNNILKTGNITEKVSVFR